MMAVKGMVNPLREGFRDKKYLNWLERYGLERLRTLAEEGLEECEITSRVGIEPETFAKWKKKYPEFADALTLGRADSDFHVIRALYKKATGFNVGLKKTYKLKRVEFDPQTGKKLREYEELVTGMDETFIPGDLSAEKYWLENRRGDRWGGKDFESMADENDECGVLLIPDADLIDEQDDEDEQDG